MPGEFSTKGSEVALDAWSGRATQSARTTYLALLSSAPGDSTTLASMPEITTSGYARQAITWTAPTGDPASTSNSAPVVFGPFTADPPNVTHVALVSASVGPVGDFLGFWTLDAAKDAASGESIQFNTGAISMTLD